MAPRIQKSPSMTGFFFKIYSKVAAADATGNTFANTVGKGSFTLSNGALTEDLTFCSSRAWVGKYNIPVTFNGPDEFTQTISDTVNKVTSIKTYKRVSK